MVLKFRMIMTKECFICKVSAGISDRLTEMGCSDGYSGFVHSDEVKTMTVVFRGKDGLWYWTLTGFPPSGEGVLNCGYNEKLFFDVVASLMKREG